MLSNLGSLEVCRVVGFGAARQELTAQGSTQRIHQVMCHWAGNKALPGGGENGLS